MITNNIISTNSQELFSPIASNIFIVDGMIRPVRDLPLIRRPPPFIRLFNIAVTYMNARCCEMTVLGTVFTIYFSCSFFYTERSKLC